MLENVKNLPNHLVGELQNLGKHSTVNCIESQNRFLSPFCVLRSPKFVLKNTPPTSQTPQNLFTYATSKKNGHDKEIQSLKFVNQSLKKVFPMSPPFKACFCDQSSNLIDFFYRKKKTLAMCAFIVT